MGTTTLNVKLSTKESQALRLIVARQNEALEGRKLVDITPEMVIRGLLRAEAREQGIDVDSLPGVAKKISGAPSWSGETKPLSENVLRLQKVVGTLTKTHGMSQSAIAAEIRKDPGAFSGALHGNKSESATERMALACEDLLRRVMRGGVAEVKDDEDLDEDQEEEEVPSTERPKSDPEDEDDDGDDDDGIPLDDLSGDDEDFSP